jgi:hypothetical protein
LLEAAAGLFGSGSGAADASSVVDVKALHAKIGELTLENDFLAGALATSSASSSRNAAPDVHKQTLDRQDKNLRHVAARLEQVNKQLGVTLPIRSKPHAKSGNGRLPVSAVC